MVLIFGLQTGGGDSRQLLERFSSFGGLGLNVLTLNSSLVSMLTGFLSRDPNSHQTLLSELQTLTQLSKFLSKARHCKNTPSRALNSLYPGSFFGSNFDNFELQLTGGRSRKVNHSKTPEDIFKHLSESCTAGLLPSPPDAGTTTYRSESLQLRCI